MAKKRGLGRGLDALLGSAGVKTTKQNIVATAVDTHPINVLPVDRIHQGRFQPRRDFDADKLQELADSISVQGIVQPIVVRSDGDQYEIVAGERRWRAAQLAGLSDIPVVIKDIDDQATMAMGLIENIQRDDLNSLEEAVALERLLSEFELTHQQIAQILGKSRASVTNLIRLLDLTEEAKDFLRKGTLNMGHSRALLGLKGDDQIKAAKQVVQMGLSVRETEKLVRRLQGEVEEVIEKKVAQEDPNITQLCDGLMNRLGAQVAIKQDGKGKGKLIISYHSLAELEGIIGHIQ